MIPLSEILNSLQGAWGLLHRQPDAMTRFNLTLEGFWRSFLIYIFVAPLQFGVMWMLTQSVDAEMVGSHPVTYFGAAFVYLAHLATFPILMIFLSRYLKLEHNYIPYIIVQNWAGVIEFMLYSVAVAFIYVGLFSSSIFAFVGLILMVLFLLYEWYVTRIALGSSSAVSAGLVAIRTLLTLVLQEGLGRLFAL